MSVTRGYLGGVDDVYRIVPFTAYFTTPPSTATRSTSLTPYVPSVARYAPRSNTIT